MVGNTGLLGTVLSSSTETLVKIPGRKRPWSLLNHVHGRYIEISEVKQSRFRPLPLPKFKFLVVYVVNLNFDYEIELKCPFCPLTMGQIPWSRSVSYSLYFRAD